MFFRTQWEEIEVLTQALLELVWPDSPPPSADRAKNLLEHHVADGCIDLFFRQLPAIRASLETDLAAALDGDPAATGAEEVLRCYPGFFAVAVHRLAHALHLCQAAVLPRMMAEYAHSRTGIDIHPGAQIGDHFFIDHGTGVVIGETTVIGSRVKLYQGVTLGALSTRAARTLHGIKRHPTIEDEVTVYAGASILGGNTVIGRGCTVGSNVFLTDSLAPGTTVTLARQQLLFRSHAQEK